MLMDCLFCRHQIKSEKLTRSTKLYDEHGKSRNFTYLKFKILLKRTPDFYLSIIVYPCLLLSMLNFLCFWLPPETPAKTMLSYHIFSAFSIVLILLSQVTPHGMKYFPLFGYYCCINMFLCATSAFLAAIVIEIYSKADYRQRLPLVLRRFVVDGLGPFLLMQQIIPLAKLKLLQKDEAKNNCIPTRICTTYGNNKKDESNQFTDQVEFDILSDNETDQTVDHESLLEQQIRYLSKSLAEYARKEHIAHCRSIVSIEWRTFALVLDRLFMFIYLILNLISILLFMPYTHDSTLINCIDQKDLLGMKP
ncbi:hypothetical protein Ciccas_014263 [Cichlidogyrus casuarinus]|uniref:Neurotransmitter-gated ion-channel transmembrane domain-containing protein n=1 Tax=Cichlidogyrus casuarinus TaxID=1844966 RepID=A0ABD2PJN5_9PLAT